MPELVNVIGPDNQPYHVKAEDLEVAIAKGYREATPEDVAVRKVADSPAGVIAAGFGSAADALTFGGFKSGLKALEGVGPIPENASKIFEAAKEENPVSAGLGTAGGFARSLGKGIASGADAAGQAARQAVLKTGEQTISRRVGARAAQYATEGLVFSAPKALGELAAGDPAEAAQTLAFGAGINVGISGPMLGAVRSTQAAARGTSKGLSWLLSKAPLREGGKKGFERIVETTEGLEKALIAKSVNIGKADRARMAPEKFDDLVDFVKEQNLVKVFRSNKDIVSAVESWKQQAGETMNRVFSDADSRGRFIDGRKLLEAYHAVGSKIPNMRLARQRLKQFRDARADLMTMTTGEEGQLQNLSFADAMLLKGELGAKAFDKNGTARSSAEVLRELERTIDGAIEDGLEAAATEFPNAAADWRNAKRFYRNYKLLEKPMQKLVAAEQNNLVSLTDLVAAGAGGSVASLPGALVGTLLNVGRRNYGSQIGAAALGRFNRAAKDSESFINGLFDSVYQAKQRAVSGGRMVKETAQSAASKVPAGSRPAVIRALSLLAEKDEDRTQTARRVAENLHAYAANPELLTNALADYGNELGDLSPRLQEAYKRHAADAIAALQKVAPDLRNADDNPFEPPTPALTDTVLMRFEQQLDAALNPAAAVQDIIEGRGSRYQALMLQQVYPAVYERITRGILERADEGAQLPTERKRALSLLLGNHVESLSQPAKLARFQAKYQQNKQAQQQAQPRKKLKLSGSNPYETQIQRVTAR